MNPRQHSPGGSVGSIEGCPSPARGRHSVRWPGLGAWLGVWGILLSLGNVEVVHAKRLPPPKVPPIEQAGVRYEAPNQDGRRAVVKALDAKDGRLRWEVVVFEVRIDPALEADVQHVYIKRMVLDGGALRVTAENGREYRVDLGTRRVSPIPAGPR